jgi:hypothetical protein
LLTCVSKPSPILLVILGVSVAVPIYFIYATGLVWEDFLITYRFSENLARGHGLVYSPGERVYGFTSPLNTLLPALFAWIFHARDFVLPLWLYRIVSLAGLVFALVSITSILTRDKARHAAGVFVCLFFPLVAVLEIKTTAFAMSGQEAGLVLGFLAPAFALAWLGWPAHATLGGILWAGLMYSRPDGCQFIAGLVIAALAYETVSRKALLTGFGKSALICAGLYLPWFLFTWTYYGSPIPHTVVAKFGLGSYDHDVFGLFAPVVAGMRKAPEVLCWALTSIYDWQEAGPGSWPAWVHDDAFALELLAVLYWLIPTRDRLGRMASLFSFYLFCYLVYVYLVGQNSPWYYPPLAFMSVLTLVSAIASLAGCIRNRWLAQGAGLLMVAGLLGFLLFIFSSSLAPLRFKQQVIEWNHRRLIGLWLKEHVGRGESVYLEPLGYIGYFSECKMLDWPGLVAPEVVAARRKLGTKYGFAFVEVAEALKPDWIVARRTEATAMERSRFLQQNYELIKVFDVRDQLQPVKYDIGMSMVYAETVFGILHRIK